MFAGHFAAQLFSQEYVAGKLSILTLVFLVVVPTSLVMLSKAGRQKVTMRSRS